MINFRTWTIAASESCLAAPATILKESLKGTGRPGMGCDGGAFELQRLGCCN